MNVRHVAILGWTVALVAVMLAASPALAGHEWIMLHHEDQGQGQQSFDQCMPIESWNGHEDHEGDYYEGPFDNDACEAEEPTDVSEPTSTEEIPTTPTEEIPPTPTEVGPEPTPTPVEESEPTPTPTDEGCQYECVPTSTPTEELAPAQIEELPDTGLAPWEWDGRVWQVEPFDNVWFGHNGDGGIGTEWVMLERGDIYAWGPTDFEVVGVLRVDPADTWVLDLDYDAVLVTCTGYNITTGEWKYRLVVLLEELG